MGNKLLLSLAELKIHVHDEHACSSNTKEPVKRRFGTKAERRKPTDITLSSAQPATDAYHTADIASNLSVPSAPGPSTSTLPQPVPNVTPSSTSELADCAHNDADKLDNAAASDGMRSLFKEFDQLLETEEIDPPEPCVDSSIFPKRLSVPLADLLDFRDLEYWKRFEQAGEDALNDEKELCKLLDAHVGNSEGHVTLDIDSSTESIFANVFTSTS